MKKGKCRICGKYCDLTYEHIPPEKAFNGGRAKVITGDELLKTITDENRLPWEYDGLQYESQQRGVGLYSLCASCNNLTGSLFGTEYYRMCVTFYKMLNEIDLDTNKSVLAHIEKVYITRFARQVLSMFCSTCEGLVQTYPEIRKIILDKNYVLTNIKDFRLSMFLLKEYRIAYTGPNAIAFGNGKVKLIAEIDAYPFGFIFDYDPDWSEPNEDLDINCFLEFKYDDLTDVDLPLNIRERNIIFPADYRNKECFTKKRSSKDDD